VTVIPGDFSATLRYHATAEPDTLLADLDKLRDRRRAAQAQRWTLVALPIGWGGLGLLAAIALGGGFLYFLAIVWAIGGFVWYSYLDADLARQILEVRRLKTARALVRALACDVGPGDKLELMIRFGPYNDPAFRVGDEKGAAASFCHPWLEAKGRFADGTRFEVGIELHAKRKERSKRKGRKKIKEDLCEHVWVVLRPDALPDGTEAGWPARVRRASLPGTSYIHRAEVKKDRVALEVRTQHHVRVTDKGAVLVGKDIETELCGPHHVLKPLLGAYTALATKGA
jgi:hypothetical protein